MFWVILLLFSGPPFQEKEKGRFSLNNLYPRTPSLSAKLIRQREV